MKIGAHISAAGGVKNLLERAKAIHAETFQFFSRSPQGGKAPELPEDIVKTMKEELAEQGIKDYYIHAPYYINLASEKPQTVQNSIRILREECERGTILGAHGMMFHPGSAKERDRQEALEQATQAVKEIVKGYEGTCSLLIENSAGAGNVLGSTFEEVAVMLAAAKTETENAGVCLDTQHMFASGYDLRTEKAVNETFQKIEDIIGWENVYVMHFNDSKPEFGQHKDRHEHIGKGHIGIEGWRAIMNHKAIQKMNCVLETPKKSPEEDIENIKTLKELIIS